jgi:hypothetical protein
MKQTAITWLKDNLLFEVWAEEHFKHNEECWNKAKEMEKEQLEKLKDFDTWKKWKNE